MADLFVVQELRSYLIAEGLVQDAADPPSKLVPSVRVDPDGGAPLPRRSQGGAPSEIGTVTLLDTQVNPPTSLLPALDECFVDVVIRMTTEDGLGGVARCRLLHRIIRERLAPQDSIGGRKGWMMNDLRVEYSYVWRGEQPLPQPDDGPTTKVISRVQSYCIAARRKSLAGLPYVP